MINIPRFLGILGLLTAALSLMFILKIRDHDKMSLKTKGKVIAYKQLLHHEPPSRFTPPDYTKAQAPVIEFTTFIGEKYTFTSGLMYASQDVYPIGSSIEILYDPSDPTKANVAEGMYLTPTILFFIGIVSTFIGYYFNRRNYI